jgi:3-oxoadipate enol-lactonase
MHHVSPWVAAIGLRRAADVTSVSSDLPKRRRAAPAIDAGQVSLFYQDSLFHQGGRAGAPPILLLRELGGSSASWQSVIPLLSPGRRVIAVDLRGAGGSEKPPGPFEVADLADDLAEMLSALGIAQADIMGAAFGSLVGALLAIRHPACVRRLVMCAVADDMAGTTAQYLEQRAEHVRWVGMRGVADASLASAFPETHAAARAAYRTIYLANDPNAYADMSLALARLRMRPEDWGTIRGPTLVLSGAHDFIWPPERGRRVAQLVLGARFTTLADAGHFPHLQTPGALAETAAAFLA